MPRPAELSSSSLEPTPSRSALRIAGGVVLGLILVVTVAVLAVGSGGEDRAVSVPQMGEPTEWFDLTIAVLGVLSVLVFVLVVVAALTDTRGSSERTRPSRIIPGMLVSGAYLWFVISVSEFDEAPELIEAPPTSTTVSAAANPEPSMGSMDVAPILAGVVLLVAAMALIAWSIRRGRTTDRGRADHTEIDQRRDILIGLLDDAIDRLRAHPDPREAVIATWSRLEVAFRAVDIGREPSDTPARYLAKVLGAVEASAPAVAHLTTTFERAMFSPAAIDRSDLQQAVDALVAVRDELQVLTRARTDWSIR